MWVVILSITLVIVPLRMPNAGAYTTPGSGVIWDMDDLVANSGGAVTGGSGTYTFHETVTIAGAPTPDTLNINPGDVCYFDFGSDIKLEIQGTLNALGGGAGIVFTSNGAPPDAGDWNSIYFSGGVGEIYNCLIEYAGSGITIMDGSVTINKSTITNNLATGIYVNGGTVEIKYSDIFGWNATSGSFRPGGNGINCTGTASGTIIIDGNNITGGDGDDFGGSVIPDGGAAISCQNFDGKMEIRDNYLIKGGNGGDNNLNDGRAGAGGHAICFSPVADYLLPPAINISENQNITGGDGGDNNALQDGIAGWGGDGINISDDDSTGQILVVGNNKITGGIGGDNHADYVSGWIAGKGGNGISLYYCSVGYIRYNDNISGGKGGNNTGVGALVSPPLTAGCGGHGIFIYNSTNITVENSNISGGDGGNNTVTGTSADAGGGGQGVYAFAGSDALIFESKIRGGEGGDIYVDSQIGIPKGAGGGGDGIRSDNSFVYAENINITGGEGGDNYGEYSCPNVGGYGIYVLNWGGVSANGGSITGGKGGDDYHPNGWLWPRGSHAIYISNGLNSEYQHLTIRGGAGGNNYAGSSVAGGGYGERSIYAYGGDTIDIHDNPLITAGSGGIDYVGGIKHGDGTPVIIFQKNIYNSKLRNNYILVAQYGAGMDVYSNILIDNNTIVGINSEGGGAIGVHKEGKNTVISNNTIFGFLDSSSSGTIFCQGQSSPLIINNIIDTTSVGIYTFGAFPYIVNTTITNSTIYGIRPISSSYLIENSTITHSGLADFFIRSKSQITTLNTSFNGAKVDIDGNSNLTVKNYLDVSVLGATLTPISGVDVNVTDNGEPIYQTTGFGGSESQTDSDGFVRWILITDRIYNGSNTATENITTLEVSHPFKTFVDNPRDVNMSTSHTEIFVEVGFPLYEGWNLVSIPYIQSDTGLSSVLDSINGFYDAVQQYNASDGFNHWKHYQISKPSHLNDLHTIDHSMGFWIYITRLGGTGFVWNGTKPIENQSITLYPGWNLVSYPSLTSYNRTEGLNNITYGSDVDAIWTYNSKIQKWEKLGESDYFEIGRGYYIHSKVEKTWVVPL
ncbi:MAG: hypothetical protein JSW00_03345 [Thermoplasmata archaeon]|nr:MAG: hypothetical protein JSW00_03345 [Thermoplasmata archaeon]